MTKKTKTVADGSSIDSAVTAYRKLRDHKDAIKQRHKEELAPIDDQLYKLETWFLKKLNSLGCNSAKTPHGTVFKTTRTSTKVEDWEAVLSTILEEERWDLLEQRVSRQAVEEYVEEHGTTPPGVKFTSEVLVNVRRN